MNRPASPFRQAAEGSGVRIVLVAALLLAPAAARAADTVVYPTGEWPTDVYNVQEAVDAGGRVLLKATDPSGAPTPFNFGTQPPRTVRIGRLGRDVDILGETLESAMTTIVGGRSPLSHVGGARVAIGIRGIHFDRSISEAIYLDTFKSAEVVGNLITNVQAYQVGGLSVGKGIMTWGANPHGSPHGPLDIRDNRIENVGGALSYGIEVLAPSAPTTVEGNTIRTVNSNGVIVLYAGAITVVRGNDVRPGFLQVPGTRWSTANGIYVEGDAGGSVQVLANLVHCVDPESDGVVVAGTQALPVRNTLVSDNTLIMENSAWEGIALVGEVSSVVVSRNRLVGSGDHALSVTHVDSPDASARNNVFMDNDVSDYESANSDVLVNTNAHGTLLVRQSGTVLDLGVLTRIVP